MSIYLPARDIIEKASRRCLYDRYCVRSVLLSGKRDSKSTKHLGQSISISLPSQRKLTTIRKVLQSFVIPAKAEIQDKENSSKRTIVPIDPEHLNNVNNSFGEFIFLDLRIREEVAGIEMPYQTSATGVELRFSDSSERKLVASDKNPSKMMVSLLHSEYTNKVYDIFERFSSSWIPAFAGMTKESSSLRTVLREYVDKL